jgi:hypothetical protein
VQQKGRQKVSQGRTDTIRSMSVRPYDRKGTKRSKFDQVNRPEHDLTRRQTAELGPN